MKLNLFKKKMSVSCLIATIITISSSVSLFGQEGRTLTKEVFKQAVEKAEKGDLQEIGKISKAIGMLKKKDLPSELLPSFISFLQHENTEVQLLGTSGLFVLKDTQSMESLKAYLKKKDFKNLEKKLISHEISERSYGSEIRAASLAILTLGEIGDRSVVPLLESLKTVKDLKFEFGGSPVFEALAKLDFGDVASLNSLGEKPGSGEIMAAEKAIRGIKNPKKVPALIATVKDDKCNARLRIGALGALADMMKEAETFPFLLSVLKDEKYPLYLRESAVGNVARSKTDAFEVEALLAEIVKDPKNELYPASLVAMMSLNPERYLTDILNRIIDKNAPLKEREKLANGLYNKVESGYYISKEQIAKREALMLAGIGAVLPDGEPADKIRILIWKTYNVATDKEPQLEVVDGMQAKDSLSFKQKFRKENVHAPFEEGEKYADEKIKKILIIKKTSDKDKGNGK